MVFNMRKTSTILIAIVLVLLAVGVVMLASSSSARAGDQFKDPNYYLKRQVVWLVLAVAAGTMSAFVMDYHWLRKPWVVGLLVAVTVVLLVLVFVPGVGCRIGGASRWLKLGSFRIGQPSELAKFTVLVLLSAWMTHVGHRAARLKEGLIIPIAALGFIALLIFAEPDFGTTLLVGMTGMAVMFVGGTKLSYLAVTAMAGASGFALAIMQSPERVSRFMAFLDPNSHKDDAYQLMQSMSAFVLGGGRGVGLGKSIQKHSYLPEAHTDFILAIIGEELGVAAPFIIVALFVGFVICGLHISLKSTDMFGRLLAFGITVSIAIQAVINIAVVTGCMPTKGLPLPFISAGGSSLVMTMFCVGVLINIARHAGGAINDPHTRTIKDRMHEA